MSRSGLQTTETEDGNRRFYGRGRHLVGKAKNSDGLGRVIVSVQNGGERIQVRRLLALNRYVPARFPLFAKSQQVTKKRRVSSESFWCLRT